MVAFDLDGITHLVVYKHRKETTAQTLSLWSVLSERFLANDSDMEMQHSFTVAKQML